MPNSLIASLVKQARKVLLAVRERTPVTIDECALEHMLLYHGLIGSSPENHREFRDVKADILSAINHQRSSTLAIALKLPPLWWEDKLKSIFAELSPEKKAIAAELLIADELDEAPENRPISHSDWRVRSNAAILLAFSDVAGVAKILAGLLDDTSDSGRMAFCYVSRALGSLQTDEGKRALAKHVHQSEPWFRVDATAALALYPLKSVGELLVKALQGESELKDYMSVAVARNHLPSEFFKTKDEQLLDGGCELIIGILQAATGTFKEEIVYDTQTLQCLEPLSKLAIDAPTPLRAAAALYLYDWLLEKSEVNPLEKNSSGDLLSVATLKSRLDSVTESYLKTDVADNLRQALANKNFQQPDQLSSLRYALQLAGRLRLANTEPLLKTALQPDFPLLPEVIDAVGQIGQISSAKPLLNLAQTTVDLEQRNSMPKNKQPVLEEHAGQAKTFWRILKALGNIPSADSLDFLLKATGDFAPDQRAQALSSLVNVLKNNDKLKFHKLKDHSGFEAVLTAGLHDPSPLVQLVALKGAASIGTGKIIADVVRLIDARENTVSKQAFSTLSELSKKGYSKEVSELLRPRLKGQREQHKKRQIEELLLGSGKAKP